MTAEELMDAQERRIAVLEAALRDVRQDIIHGLRDPVFLPVAIAAIDQVLDLRKSDSN